MKRLLTATLGWLLVMSPALSLQAAPKPAPTPQTLTATGNTHGINYSWTASASAAGCTSSSTPACAGGYNLFIGSASGQESTTPVNSALITGLAYSWTPTTSPLGTTVCAVVQFQETISTLVLSSPNSTETCYTFPSAPAAPGAPAVAPF
jgi:hypothetical protein